MQAVEHLRKLRILFLGNIAPCRIGGAEVQARWLVQCFAARGHHVTIAGYAVPHGGLSSDQGGGTPIETIHLAARQATRMVQGASFFAHLSRFLLRRKGDFDLVFCSTFKDATLVVVLLKRLGLLKQPVVVRCEGYGDSGDVPFLKSLPATRWLVHLLNQGCDRINSISPMIEAELAELGLQPRLFTCIPNGVPLPQLEETVRFPLHAPRSFLFAGRLVPQKGVADLLMAASALKKQGLAFQVNLVGDGILAKNLKHQAGCLGIDDRVRFHGQAGPEQMPRHYRENHFLVLPSHREAFGMVAAEAMSHGRPVIVTRSGGPEYYVDRHVGRVCPAGDVAALTHAMQEMIQMPQGTLQVMGSEARRRVELQFDIERVADRFLDLFARLTN